MSNIERRIAATEDLAAIFALSDAQLKMTAAGSTDDATNEALREIDEAKGLIVKPILDPRQKYIYDTPERKFATEPIEGLDY